MRDQQAHEDQQPDQEASPQRPRHSLGVRACLALIGIYRRHISPLTPPSCRFTPTCSQYALEAYAHFGVMRGTWKTLTRLLRCHPWHPGGHDPVIKDAKKYPKKK